MSQWMMRAGTTLALVALTAGMAFAAPPKAKPHPKPAKAAAATCPVCHMPLSKTKTAANPVAVKTPHGVMYCCSKCKMPASDLAKPSAKGGAHKGGHMGKKK
ncbi:MAG TPA: hypothetical protein VFA07_18530 [Chthonomonadaceae bacterium]|nr:hypothetical protein [Chthonomonadaceae bacterium]